MNTSPETSVTIRHWRQTDDVAALTELLHRAYAPLAQRGLRFHATWQDAATTLDRLQQGVPFVAEQNGIIVGTITLYVPPNVSGCEWYDRGDVAVMGQLGVEPALGRQGIGGLLLNAAENEARQRGIPNLALDTAESATHLIEIYTRRGFVKVGTAQWDVTNYRSIIMNKVLALP